MFPNLNCGLLECDTSQYGGCSSLHIPLLSVLLPSLVYKQHTAQPCAYLFADFSLVTWSVWLLECCRGNYTEALIHYERGLLESHATADKKPHSDQENHNLQCQAGVARTAIRCGDIRRGVSIAADTSSSRQLKRDCAEILESMKVGQEWTVLLLVIGNLLVYVRSICSA
jgi:hypothetical protein